MASDYPEGCAFILGGSGQLGQAAAFAFARANVPMAITYYAHKEAGTKVVNALKQTGEAALYQLDGSDRAAVVKTLAQAAERFGKIHSVVYAGGADFTPQFFSKTDESVWRNWLQNDLLSCINLAQSAIPHLREAGGGSFTALSTYQCRMVEVRGSHSAISKSAIDTMVRAIAKEEGRHGIRANTVQAGWFAVEGPLRLIETMPHLQEEKKRTIPLGRLGRPEELGEVVAFLASRQAGFITGVNLTADGGESL